MPEAIFEKIKEQKTFNAGMLACRQLLYGQVDMELHSNYDATKGATNEGESIFGVQRRMAKKYTPFSMPLPEHELGRLAELRALGSDDAAALYHPTGWILDIIEEPNDVWLERRAESHFHGHACSKNFMCGADRSDGAGSGSRRAPWVALVRNKL